MESTLIGEALKYAKALFENDSSGHDYFHTLRVCKTALTLAETEHADPLVTGLAAALHDADDRKLSPETTKTKANARAFLRENGVAPQTEERILNESPEQHLLRKTDQKHIDQKHDEFSGRTCKMSQFDDCAERRQSHHNKHHKRRYPLHLQFFPVAFEDLRLFQH